MSRGRRLDLFLVVRRCAVALLIAVGAGCGSTPVAPAAKTTFITVVKPTEPGHLVSVSLQGVATLGLGESSRYHLYGSLSSNSTAEYSGSAEWTSVTPALLKMDKGVATGLAPGAAKIQTTLVTEDGTFVATKDIQVLATPPAPPSSLVMSNSCESLYIIGQPCWLQLLTNSGSNVSEFASWTSTDPRVAGVSGGYVTPLASGMTDLTATYLGVSTVFRVTVYAPVSMTVTAPFQTIYVGQRVLLDATARFTNGRDIPISSAVSWTASNAGVVSVAGGSSAAMTGVSSGTADVAATYGTVTGSLHVTVIPTAVDALSLSPPQEQELGAWTGNVTAGGFAVFATTVNYVLTSAPTGRITIYVRDQKGVDVSFDLLNPPRAADVSSGQGSTTTLYVGVRVPLGTTMLCPSAVMRGGVETTVTGPCRAVTQ
jgi:hypothetical protein